VLQAIFEYQTAICELTGMDVSNASGYDGTTVAADACYLARQATGRSKVVLTEALNPQVRQVVKTYAPGFGLDVVEVPHRDGTTDPDELRAAAGEAACVIFQQPNFFGCLEPAPDLAAAANDAGALPVAHVDPVSLGVLEARACTGARSRSAKGQSAGNYQSYGGPHYGFWRRGPSSSGACRAGSPVETVDSEAGGRLRPDAADAGAATSVGEGHLQHHDEQTLLALAGLVHLSWLGPQGLRELGETCLALSRYAKERLSEAGLELVFQKGNVQGVCRTASDDPRRTRSAMRARRASIPATRSVATTRAWTTRCSSR